MKRTIFLLLFLLSAPETKLSGAPALQASSPGPSPSSSRIPGDGPAEGTPIRRDSPPPRFTLAFTHTEPTSQASAFADFFGSGRPDIFIAAKGRIHVIRNEGAGVFRHGGTWTVDHANGWGAHDLDGNGRLDLFIAQQEERGSKDALILPGTGTFTQTSLGNESLLPARSVLFADFDGDGITDSYHTGSAFSDNHNWNQLHRGLPGGRFGPNVIDEVLDPPVPGFWHKTASGPAGCSGEWSNKQFKGAVVRDFDGDGKPDIATTAYADLGYADERCLDYAHRWVEAQDRGIFILRNVSTPGAIRFRDVSQNAVPGAYGATSSDMNAYHAVPLDFDRDGDFDLFVGATVRRDRETGGFEDTPAVRFLENVSTPGSIRFLDRTRDVGLGWLNDLPPAERTKRNLAAGVPIDADNDGFVDLVLANRDNAPDFASAHMFRNAGGVHFELIDPAAHGIGNGAGGRDVSAADLDADGCIDVVLADGEVGGYTGADNARIYINQCQTPNRWIALDVTDENGVTLTGARVEVFDPATGARLGLDEVRTDVSYRGKRLPRLHFGLGVLARVDVEIRLAGGQSQRFSGLEANRVHHLSMPPVTYDVRVFDGRVTDTSRSREIAYRLYWPEGATGLLPVLLFSHGGDGNTTGHTVAPHLGTEWARHGFLAIHINHRPSSTTLQHERDRPADVSFVLDRLQSGDFPLPPGLTGTPDLARVGHAGHSWGAYTSHAVGGAVFEQGTFRDPRILAIAPISPQGPGSFGAFDRGPDDNSWKDVPVPAYTLVGNLEKDHSTRSDLSMPDWRLYPFNRYRVPPDRFLSVLPGQDHGDMIGGPPEVQAFVAENTRRFFEVYVAGRSSGACGIGFLSALPGTDTRRKGGPEGFIAGCPEPRAPVLIDCTDSPACPQLTVLGDPLATMPGGAASPARGYADAALELDPVEGDLALAYTFVSTQPRASGSTSLDLGASVHLARSGDGGRTFKLSSVIWESAPEADPVTDAPGYSGHEVPSLAPGLGGWWGTHVRVHDPAGGGNNRRSDAFHLVVARASRPEEFGAVKPLRLSGTAASDAWGIDHRLSSLSPEIEQCTLWLDPEFVVHGDHLYLLASCVVYEGGIRLPERGFYGVFELPVAGEAAGTPRWIGRITEAADAALLGGEEISKADVSLARDGSLLLIVAPVRQGERFEEYSGCHVLSIESLDPPRLLRENGTPVARAIIRSSDSVPTSGSCAYHPESETGVVVTRRELVPGEGRLVWSLHATGFHP